MTVRLEPEPLTPVIEAPETPLVVRAKSEETTGETDSEKVTVKEIELELVGLEAAIEETEGAVLSTVYTWPVKPPEIALPAASWIPVPEAFRFRPSVPSPVPVEAVTV